jgi:Ca-activated chloride channel family protein
MTDVRWADPFLLHLIALLPVLVLVGILLWWRRRREVAEALGDPALVRRLAGTDLRAFPRRRAALLLPAAALLGVAAAGPRWGTASNAPNATQGDVVLVLDASNSMLAEDVPPSRLEREREAARALVDRLGGRVGLVAFGGSGQVLSPLTSDAPALHLYLDALSPEIVNQSGTSLYSALRHALELLGPAGSGGSGGPPGSIVLVSDGEALDPPRMVDLSVEEAARRGVPIHTVGIGTAAGGPVPDVDDLSGRRIGFKREPDGTVATSRLDEATLRRIAQATGGTYTGATDARSLAALAAAASRGGRAARARGESLPDNRYAWPLALALVLVVIDALTERGRRRQG